MFEDSLIEQKIKTHRGAATILSFLLQALVVVIIVLLPLMFTQALPLNVHMVTELVAPPPPPPPPPPAVKAALTPQAQPKATPVPVTEQLTEPVRIPQKIAMVHDLSSAAATNSAPPPAGVVGGVPGGVPGGQVGGVLGGVLNSTGTTMPEIAVPKRIRVSQGVSQGLLIHKVTPQYPPVAKTARVQGVVVLQAEIGKNGKIQDLQVIKGQPLLTSAAINAVKQWRYKPYFVNGQAVDVDTTITVDFKLNI